MLLDLLASFAAGTFEVGFRLFGGQTLRLPNSMIAVMFVTCSLAMLAAQALLLLPAVRKHIDHRWVAGAFAGSAVALGFAALVAQNPSIRAPSFNMIGFFLAAYLIALVPVNYYVLKRRRRLELAWVTAPAIVVLFTLGAYAIGYTMKGGELKLSEASFIEGSSNSRYARVVSTASLFSPARRNYDVEAADQRALIHVVAQNKGEYAPRTTGGEKSVIENLPLAMWSSRTFLSTSGADIGGHITSNLLLDGGRVTGEIQNNTGLVFENCIVVYGASKTNLGKLATGQKAAVDVRRSPSRSGHMSVVPQGGPLRDRLWRFAVIRAEMLNAPVLVAFASAGDGVFGLRGQSAATESEAVYVIRKILYRRAQERRERS